MSRVSIIERLYGNKNKKSALEFNYDLLMAPPIRSLFSEDDIRKLYQIATSLKYNANIEKKYDLIDEVMKSRGFRRAHCGTNRVVYNFIYDTTFVAKVAIDKVGMEDSPAEFKNQEFFKPFCCKIFEVDPTGVLAFVERVNPITSLEEFLSVSDDIFNMMITKIIGKYVVDDLGTSKFMNYGLRYNSYTGHTFGPVIIDFPYAYELDGAKLICQKPLYNTVCGGEIDYDIGFNTLICTKCGKKYTAMDLKKNTSNVLIIHDGGDIKMRVRIRKNGKVVYDSGLSSKTYITEEDYNNLPAFNNDDIPVDRPVTVSTKKMIKRKSKEDYYNKYFLEPQMKFFNQFNKQNDVTTKKIIKVRSNSTSSSDICNDEKYCSGVKISKVKDADNNIVYDSITTKQEDPIITNEQIDDTNKKINEPNEIDDPIDQTVIKMQERENMFNIIAEENFKINNHIESTITQTEEQTPDSLVNILLDYHSEDDENYNMKQKRDKKRKDKKHYKNRNRGFNRYDDEDMDNF